MSGIHYYIIDLETTGLKCGYHEVTEISIIRFDDRRQLTRNVICEFPKRASADALEITGKTISDLSFGYDKNQVVKECTEFFEKDGLTPDHRCIVGHNIIGFDKKFLFQLWQECGLHFPAHLWLDTLQMTKAYVKSNNLNEGKDKSEKLKTNLQAACDLLGIKKVASMHNAKADSQNTFFLQKKLMEEMNHLLFMKTDVHPFGAQSQGCMFSNDEMELMDETEIESDL
jgi:DNA polymerase III alpha subunit (gram-positive type)